MYHTAILPVDVLSCFSAYVILSLIIRWIGFKKTQFFYGGGEVVFLFFCIFPLSFLVAMHCLFSDREKYACCQENIEKVVVRCLWIWDIWLSCNGYIFSFYFESFSDWVLNWWSFWILYLFPWWPRELKLFERLLWFLML